VQSAHRGNLQVHVWTINDPDKMQRYIDMGVDGIMTDRPDLLLELISSQ
jgi:glycerophosphoryl diester phosphodiesterase